jgi:hypothetical protein
MDIGAQSIEFCVDPPGSFHHDGSLGGGEPGGAIDQGRAEFLLKPGNMGRNVGLHGVKRSSGSGEAAMIDNGKERRELAEVHHK